MDSILAEPFASSAAGYVTGIGVPVLLGLVAYVWKSVLARITSIESVMARHTEALAKHSQALSMLIETTDQISEDFRGTARLTSELDKGLAVLSDRMTRHESWTQREMVPRVYAAARAVADSPPMPHPADT